MQPEEAGPAQKKRRLLSKAAASALGRGSRPAAAAAAEQPGRAPVAGRAPHDADEPEQERRKPLKVSKVLPAPPIS